MHCRQCYLLAICHCFELVQITVFRQINAPDEEGENEALTLSDVNEYNCELRDTSTLAAERLIEIGSVVSEIWPGKVESQRGGVHLFMQVRLFGKRR